MLRHPLSRTSCALLLAATGCRTASKGMDEAVDTSEADDTGAAVDVGPPCPVFVAIGGATGAPGTEDAPVPTIAEALAVRASDCLDVWVGPGTYTEDVDYGDIELRLIGLEGAGATTLVGTGTDAVVTIAGEQRAAELVGFRVTGGTGWSGGGTLSTTETWGGGVAVFEANALLEDIRIDGNTATGGGGGLLLHKASATMVEVIVADNTVDGGSGGEGGGVLVVEGALDAVTLMVMGNTVAARGAVRGGGIGARASEIRATDLVIEDNTLPGVTEGDSGLTGGGGIAVSATTLTLDGATLLTNTLTCEDGGSDAIGGGGLLAVQSTVDILETTLSGNGATGTRCHLRGGGIALSSVDGTLHGVDLRDNGLALQVAGRAEGGGLAVADSSPELWGLIVAGNHITTTATTDAEVRGGGMWLSRTSPEIRRSTVHANSVSASDAGTPDVAGGGLFVDESAPRLLGLLLTQNTSAGSGGGGGVHPTGTGEPDITHSDLWANTGDATAEAPASAEDGNISADPLYAGPEGTDPLLWDLSLQAGSPAIDAGDPDEVDADGTRADMGAP